MFAILQIPFCLQRIAPALVLWCLYASAAMASPYTITNVEVEATGANATEARATAREQGAHQAFRMLLDRHVSPVERERYLTLPPEAISRLIKGFQVMNEKMSADTYRATLSYTFNAAEVEGLLGTSPAAMLRPQEQRPALVLPILHTPDGLLLWEDNNIWRRAWGPVAQENGLIMPLGDIEDITRAQANLVRGARYHQLQPIAQRYQAGEVAVAEANYRRDATTGKQYLEVTLRRLGPDLADRSVSHYPVEPGVDPAELMSHAARDVARRIQALPGTFSSKAGASQSVVALVPLSSMRDWVEVRNRLQQAPEVAEVELAAISHMQADIRLHLRGKAEAVARSIGQRGLMMTQENGYWVLRLGDI